MTAPYNPIPGVLASVFPTLCGEVRCFYCGQMRPKDRMLRTSDGYLCAHRLECMATDEKRELAAPRDERKGTP